MRAPSVGVQGHTGVDGELLRRHGLGAVERDKPVVVQERVMQDHVAHDRGASRQE